MVIMQLRVLILGFSILIVNGLELHHVMTEEEIQSVFKENTTSMPGVEYDLVRLNYTKKFNNKTRRSQSILSMKVFDETYKLYIEENDNVLAGTKTPILRVVDNSIEQNTILSMIKFEMIPFPENIKIYQDVKNKAAVTMHTDCKGKNHFDGVIGDKFAIRSLPERIHKLLIASDANFTGSITGKSFHHNASFFELMFSNYKSSTPHVVVRKKKFEKNVTKMVEKLRTTWDVKVTKQFNLSSNASIPDTVYPELLIVLDYGTVLAHNHSLESMAKYSLAFWNAVDLRFRTMSNPKIRLNIAGLIIPQGNNVVPYLGSYEGDINPALLSLKNFVKNSLYGVVNFDAVIAISSQEMGRRNNDGEYRVRNGVSYLNSICATKKGFSIAIIGDDGSFSYVTTAAHELGHILGAPHDGPESVNITGGPCRTKPHGNLMSYFRRDEKGQQWSRCSISAMQKFLATKRADCIINKPDVGQPFSKVLPGKLITRDEQCQKLLNLPSFKERENDCAVLWCSKDNSPINYFYRPPAEGSLCGERMICIDAYCVPDPDH